MMRSGCRGRSVPLNGNFQMNIRPNYQEKNQLLLEDFIMEGAYPTVG